LILLEQVRGSKDFAPRLRHNRAMRLFLLAPLLIACAAAQPRPAWIERSNENAKVLSALDAKYFPEEASAGGDSAFDEQITVLSLDRYQLGWADLVKARNDLAARLAAEKDPLVRQDLQILIEAAERRIRSMDASEKNLLRYANVPQLVFRGVQTLLDDQVAAGRRPAVLARLRKYAGLEPGYRPIVELAEQDFRATAKTSGLVGPWKEQVENDLQHSSTFVEGLAPLLAKYKIQGYQEALAKLKEQLAAYDDFVRREVLPRARTDYRQPPEIYRTNLENYGVDYSPADLERLAHSGFADIQKQMQVIAAKIARERKLPSSDYRDVIRELKKEQLSGAEILPHYQRRLAEIEEIVRKNHLITLPERPSIIEIASAAETAQQPAPHMRPPALLSNHGERGVFVLPLAMAGRTGETLRYDDFTFAAASWTLTAHEARPGHELQFDAMVEEGVSLARALFAFNSTNVEGWGLYAEWMMLPYMPDEGKLVSLDYRLLRAARAFLDPELQEGKITPAQATAVLQNDVVASKAFATEEVERFTFRSPGQAMSYFDGYSRLMEIRQAAEKALGSRFNPQRFHDFILSQGLLPPNLLRKAVMEEFVK
jgi:hypothetical protein